MYDVEKLRKLLATDEYRVVDESGKVFPPSHKIYASIAEIMGEAPGAKHLYTIVKNNRNGLRDFVLRAFGLIDEEMADLNDQSKNDPSFDPNVSSSTVKLKFFLTLTWTEWLKVHPVEKNYSDGRTYLTLENWTDLFAEKLWLQHKIPCAWTFKNAKGNNHPDKGNYFKINAVCNECSARLSAVLPSEPSNEDVVFKCQVKKARPSFIHSKRRPLRGVRRAQIANMLASTKTDAISFIRDQTAQCIEFGDPYPPIIPKSCVLREAVREVKDKRLGISGAKEIDNLISAKHGTYVGGIHNIGACPFFCHYWSKEQKMIYKLDRKRDKQSFMTIDATGSLVKKIRYEHGKSSHIFLYQCMSVSSTGSVPVFQMLSAQQDTVAITTWLLKILSDGVSTPRTVVCDFSHALLIAISIAFARKADLREYMQCCFDILKGKTSACPATYIRLDVSHVVAIICRWDCIKRHPLIKVRQFFIRSLCHAYQIQSFEELEEFLQSVLTVALSQTLGSASGEKLPSQQEFERVNLIIKGMSDLELIESISMSLENHESENFKEDCSAGWVDWSTAIYDKASSIALQCGDGEVFNACCNLEIAHKIRQLMHYCSIWTGIMSSTFKVGSKIATSSSVESEFANIKNRVFKSELPLRADKFVLRHITYLDGRVKQASTRNAENKSTAPSKKAKIAKIEQHAVESCHKNVKNEHDIVNNDKIIYHWQPDGNTVIEENSAALGSTEAEFLDHRIEKTYFGNETPITSAEKQEDGFFREIDYGKTEDQSIILENNATSYLSCKNNSWNEHDTFSYGESNYYSEDGRPTAGVDNEISLSSTEVTIIDNSIEQTSLRLMSKVTHTESPAKKVKHDTDVESDDTGGEAKENSTLRATENWKGLGDLQNQKKKPNYMDAYPDWDYMESYKAIKLPIISNGLLCEAIKVDQRMTCVKQTCAFDSVVQLLAQTIGKEERYRSEVKNLNSENNTIKLASGILSRGRVIRADYVARARILKTVDLCVQSGTRHMLFLDAKCNAGHLIEKLFHNIPSVSRRTSCDFCDYLQCRSMPTLYVNVGMILEKGLGVIQDAIDDTEMMTLTKNKCKKCDKDLKRSQIYGPHLFLDLSILTDKNYDQFSKVEMNLRSIQKSVVLNDKTYRLSGVINYIEPMEHYTAMTYTGSYWYEYDDLAKERKFVRDRTVVPHVIMYAAHE